MKERERIVVTGLVVLLLLTWLGFTVHRSPRFAGSLWGGILGVSGALLMLVPLAYMVVKRNGRLRRRATKYVSMRTLLAWHIYAGIVGPIVVLLHTGHKFESPLGIALTAMALVVVISGFIGRYLMKQFTTEIREKKAMLGRLQLVYQQALAELGHDPDQARLLRPFSGFLGRVVGGFFVRDVSTEPAVSSTVEVTSPATLLRVSESMADLEYAIKTHETFKTWFGKWLKIHIVISFILYGLMSLHIWAAIHFGLRWFEPSSLSQAGRGSYVTASTFVKTPTPAHSILAPANAIDEFSFRYGQLFRHYWRSTATIRGIETTVFDYAGIAREVGQHDSDFSRVVRALEDVGPDRLGGDDREKAFWINVYNFAAMKLAAENYPIPSIIDSKISSDDPWGIKAVQVGSAWYTLKEIENAILLRKFNDPRIVLAISCAAVSCPDRTGEIFSGEGIDGQLDSIVRGLLANPTKGLSIDRDRKILKLSWILKADQRLFEGGGDDGLVSFVVRYVSPEIRSWIESHRAEITIEYFDHDWGLNDIVLADKKSEAPSQWQR
ncbi:MAG: hypothetical protein AMXMBFR13_14830 [Phycisphaerae bacterium]